MSEDYRELVMTAVLDGDAFVRATFSGQQRGESTGWVRVILRPVVVKGERHIQFAYYDDKKCITKNYVNGDLTANLDALLHLPFRNLQVTSVTGDLQVNISKSGRPIVHRAKPARAVEKVEKVETAHNRQKDLLLPEGKPDPYLQAIGFMTADGRVKADRQRKFRQINEFLKLLHQTGELQHPDSEALNIVDCGCGNAYLTFGAYHYLNHVIGQPARLVGLDVRGELLEKHAETVRDLGWEGIVFERTAIADYAPAGAPDITLALHACDTATDEALAQGIRWGSRLIISVPCCHHDLQEQIRRQRSPDLFRPVYRHGILGERLGDILTDSFRALILRIMGYQTEVVQFISPEHTARNLMIRAIRSDLLAPTEFAQEYSALKAFWGVTPHLERLLGEDLVRHLAG